MKKDARFKIGEYYWILTGSMTPIRMMLIDIVNSGTTGVFENTNIARKLTSVYQSKDEAEKIKIY